MNKRFPRLHLGRKLRFAILLLATVVLMGQSTVQVFAEQRQCPKGMSQKDCDAIFGDYPQWVPGGGSCIEDTNNPGNSLTDSTYFAQMPSGSDNPTKIWNFFTTETGLGPTATAGIMGNIQAESGFNPSAEQTVGAWQDMSSNNINHGGKGGVGLVQWDGGRRPAYIKYAQAHGADPKNIVPQLNYIWHELNTDYKTSTLDRIKADTTPSDAAFDFHAHYEISGDTRSQAQRRLDYAEAIYKKYTGNGGQLAQNGTGSALDCAGGSLSPECTAATGRARIICDAKLYDAISYREDGTPSTGHGSPAVWHSKYCPVINSSCYLDCSGLVNIAIYDVYGVALEESTSSERADNTHWRTIPFEQLQPGDLVQPNPGHVEIVDHVQGKVIYTFGAHTDRYAQPKQVGPSHHTLHSGELFLEYNESGSDVRAS